MRKLSLLAFALGLIATMFAQPARRPVTEDTILIVGLSPSAFVDGQETGIDVTVAYDLVSAEEALIDVSSNELKPQGFSPFAQVRVKKGTGTTTIPGKLVPRYWSSLTPAKIAASLTASDNGQVRRAVLARDDTRIDVARRAQPDRDPHNPNPSVVYDDTVVITSVAPDTLVEGEETEVTVTVAYELFSREEGEINLGFNEGRGNGYRIVRQTLIKQGTGEAVVRARIVPARTGKLPFAKIFVNLSEYPHRPKWSPLAGDSHTVEVR
ncbi:MAG TPA: hypothetical protein VHN79_10980 [Lacunisphaera sp.]|nr:hypothetical protein [Lacunisphaera sp.]